MRATCRYLAYLFYFDQSLLVEPDLQWQAELLGAFSSSIFVAKALPQSEEEWVAHTVDTSIEMLRLRTECLEMKARVEELTRTNQHLQATLQETEANLEVAISAAQQPDAPDETSQRATADPLPQRDDVSSLAWLQWLTWLPWLAWLQQWLKGKDTASDVQDNTLPIHVQDDTLPIHVQDDTLWIQQQDDTPPIHAQNDTLPIHVQDDILPSEPPPITFDCGICMETLIEDFVSIVASCDHTFCRDCILGHVSAELDALRYPILCPVCKADRDCLHPAGR